MAGIGDKITTVIPHYNGKAELYGCIDSLLHDEYFAEKFVIQIEKPYLCAPK